MNVSAMAAAKSWTRRCGGFSERENRWELFFIVLPWLLSGVSAAFFSVATNCRLHAVSPLNTDDKEKPVQNAQASFSFP